jgi:hypothetical protein
MAAPVRTGKYVATRPVQAKQGFWSLSFWALLKQPQYALGAAALVAFLIITPLTRRHSIEDQTVGIIAPTSTAVESTAPAGSGPLVDAAVNSTELDTLPDSLRAGAKEAISDTGGRPAALKGLEPNGETMLEYPFAEVVSEARPELRWKAFGDSYSVSLSDAHGLISRRANLKETHWTPPGALARGRVYTWEVESAGQKHRGTFRVLGESPEKELEKIRAAHGSSHLAMGAVNTQFGLLTPAKREFEAMGKDSKMAQQAAKLLSHVESLQK